MNKRLSWRLGVVLVLSLACSFFQGRGGQPGASGAADAEVSTTGNLQAEVTSPISILLTWESVPGADHYLVDLRYGDGDFFPAAQVPADQTMYEGLVFPGAIDATFRLSSVSGAATNEVGRANAHLPPIVPNPLIVQTHPYEPTVMAFPTPDLSNVDPNNLNPGTMYPPGFDPEHPEDFDPSSLFQSIWVTQEIGPEGGSLSITSPDRVVIDLHVPPGAIDEPVILSLMPVQSIDNLPLSGGLLGAVLIQPDLNFEVPAILTIERAPGDLQASSPLTVGFAVSPSSHEFFLNPLTESGAFGRGTQSGAHVASLASGPLLGGGSGSMAVSRGGTYGVGAGSVADVRTQAKRVPTDDGAQAAQHAALQQSSGTGSAETMRNTGEGILNKAASSDSMSSLASMGSQLEEYWRDGGFKYNEGLNGRLIDAFVKKLKKQFDKSKGDCLTYEDIYTSELASKLSNRANGFWDLAAQAYRTRYGDPSKTLDDILSGNKSCTFTLQIQSEIRQDDEAGWYRAAVRTESPIQLKLYYEESHLVLKSKTTGTLVYGPPYESKSNNCPIQKITQYPQIPIYIGELFPIFRDGTLTDFLLRGFQFPYVTPESLRVKVTQSEDKDCSRQMTISGGGDFWSGMFSLLRVSASGTVDNWKSSTGEFSYKGRSLVVTRTFKDYQISLEGGITLTENTTFTLTIKSASAR